MERRGFVGFAGGAAFAPLLAWAQQPGKPPVIGMLIVSNPEPFRGTFREAMRSLGYVEGRNFRMEYRSADGKSELLPRLAAELVRLKVDLIVAAQTPAATAAKQATATIPIVMYAGDPVGTGLVESLARPGGNLTGMSPTTTEMAGKLLDLVRDMIPAVRRTAVLANRDDPFAKPFLKQIQDAGRSSGIDVASFSVSKSSEIEAAFADMTKLRVDAVIVQPSLPRNLVAGLALKHRLPSFSPSSTYVGDGGLMSYSPRLEDLFRALAGYVDKVLKGAKPADLPIQQPTAFELAVNRKTARALGIAIPQSVLVRADRIID